MMSSSRLRWLLPAAVAIAWLVLGGVGGPFAGKLGEVGQNDSTAFLPKSAESTKAAALQRQLTGKQVLPAIVVAERTGGITEADQQFVRTATSGAASANSAITVLSPLVAAPNDGDAVQLTLAVDTSVDPGPVVTELRDRLRADRPAGLTVLVAGPAGQVADLTEAFGGIDGLLLLVAGVVVLVILIVVYRSPILPLVVLLGAVFALGLASLIVYYLGKNGVVELNGQSQGIMFILVFGAATDYALLLVSRYREELRDTADRYQAIRTAWRATIAPIVASAGTVMLGVLCLLFSTLASNRALGPVAAIGIGASLLAATTFLPAVLALLGRAAFWPMRPAFGSAHPETSGLWGRIAGFVSARPRAVWVFTSLALLIGAAFLPQLRASGTAQTDVFLTTVDSVTGQQVISRHFPGGTGAPAVVITRADQRDAVLAAAKVPGVAAAVPAVGTDGTPLARDGLAEVTVVLSDAADSDAALATVSRLRDAVHAVPGADALVGGPTATQLDTQVTSERDRRVIIPIVLAVIFVILALLLRALIAPLLLILTVVLSFAATMGVSALVFNHVLDFPGADPVVPLFGFVFLVALGVDYNIFLMTRVREEAIRHGTRTGTRTGLALTGGVITSAGIVLAATFSALAVLPILFLAEIAFIVAFGVLLDTLLVRTLLVPALALDIGDRIWWPSHPARSPSAGSDDEPASGRDQQDPHRA